MSLKWRQWCVLLLISAGFSMSIVYANVQTYDPVLTPATGYSDTKDYVAMAQELPGRGIRAYRPLVPWLTRFIPNLPDSFFATNRVLNPTSQMAIRFGVVNFVFLVGTCAALYQLQLGFGFDFWTSLLGVILFLGESTIIRSAGLPMIDTGFFFFFLVVLIGLQQQRWWLVLMGGILGVLAKELILLAIPLALLMPIEWRKRGQLALALIPAVAVYALLRAQIPSLTPDDGYLSFGSLYLVDDQLRSFLRPNGWINLFMAFGFAWIPAIYAYTRTKLPVLILRWMWLLPIVFVGVLLGAGNLGRSTFTAFPVVIPAAAYGLMCFLKGTADVVANE